jgi:LmbE family N-acetylglucosaminyl deacetylase
MRRYLVLLALAAIPAAAQQIDDPANLMGERVSPPALADTLPINHGAPALEQLLRKLRTRASMMLIVAHPDDEDSGLLTYESRGQGARVAMLTLTRGEGGQNLMSADFNDALGLIRTQELLAEDRYTGTDQFFGTEVDFGFSKTKEESFQKWTHDRVLYDAVRAVRLYRPLVLASVFIGGVTDGHGHHQVSGEICQEVFLAAADPKVFPEMGLPPWAPLKVYARVPFARITDQGMFDYATGKFSPPRFTNYVTGQITTTEPAATVTIHEGDKPSIPAFNGMSYVQWARQGLALQKTQIGPNVRIPPAGAFDVGYTLMGSRTSCIATKAGCPMFAKLTWASAKPTALPSKPQSPEDQDLFTGIDTTFPGLAQLAPSAPKKLWAVLTVIDNQLAEAQKLYDPTHIELTAPPLREALKLLDNLIKDVEASPLPQTEKFNLLHELRIKRVQLNNALVFALGLTFEAKLEKPDGRDLVPGQFPPPLLDFKLLDASSASVLFNEISIELPQAEAPDHIGEQKVSFRAPVLLNQDHHESSSIASFIVPPPDKRPGFNPITKPYFSRPNLEQPYYDVADPMLRNAPATPSPVVAVAHLNYEGVEIELRSPATGHDRATVNIVPKISLQVSPSVGIFSVGDGQGRPQNISVEALANSDNSRGQLYLVHEGEWKITGSPGQDASSERRTTACQDHSPRCMMLPNLILPAAGDRKTFHFSLKPAEAESSTTRPSAAVLSAEVRTEPGPQHFRDGYRSVGYPGIPYTNYYTSPTFKIVPVDVTTAPQLHIAYLPGTGDEVPQFLPSLNITPTILKPSDLTLANLKQYDAILLGVRAYSAHPELSGTGSDPLTAYAKQGGIVIAQYNSGGFTPASAPFPYSLPGDSAHNVVDETDKVTLLAPESPLLTWPNRITSADFNSWVEERGHGFASDWSPEYQPLLEMHDPDQDPQKGGLLLAPVGKGAYIYCALALYRQLPEGVPGAYRLIANLLSYAKNPSR